MLSFNRLCTGNGEGTLQRRARGGFNLKSPLEWLGLVAWESSVAEISESWVLDLRDARISPLKSVVPW